jgi:hypothetical protein
MWLIVRYAIPADRLTPDTLVLVTSECQALHYLPIFGPRLARWVTNHLAGSNVRRHLVGHWWLVRYGPRGVPKDMPSDMSSGRPQAIIWARDPRLDRLDEWKRNNP